MNLHNRRLCSDTHNYGFVYFANLSIVCDAHNYIMGLHNRRLENIQSICASQTMGTYYFPIVVMHIIMDFIIC